MTLYDCECSSVKAQYNEIIAPDILISSGAVESVFLQIQSKLLPTVVSPGIQTSTTHTQDAFFFVFLLHVWTLTHRENTATEHGCHLVQRRPLQSQITCRSDGLPCLRRSRTLTKQTTLQSVVFSLVGPKVFFMHEADNARKIPSCPQSNGATVTPSVIFLCFDPE